MPIATDSDWGIELWVVVGLLWLGWSAYTSLKTKECGQCAGRTRNASGLCNSCVEKNRQENQRRREAAEKERRERAAEERRRQAEEARRRLDSIEKLQRLTGVEFEEFIESLFRSDGYEVRGTSATGDEGIDLFLDLRGTRDVVQCKRWKNDIGSPVIRDFYGAMIHAGARQGFVITTASFTKSARSFAEGKPIILIEGQALLDWIGGETPQKPKSFDPYAVLGLRHGAIQDEIRLAYREMMTKYHPDKVAHLGLEFQEMAKERAKEINRAYEALRVAGP